MRIPIKYTTFRVKQDFAEKWKDELISITGYRWGSIEKHIELALKFYLDYIKEKNKK